MLRANRGATAIWHCPIAGQPDFALSAVAEVDDSLDSRGFDSTEFAGATRRASRLAEPFAGAVAQGSLPVFAEEINR